MGSVPPRPPPSPDRRRNWGAPQSLAGPGGCGRRLDGGSRGEKARRSFKQAALRAAPPGRRMRRPRAVRSRSSPRSQPRVVAATHLGSRRDSPPPAVAARARQDHPDCRVCPFEVDGQGAAAQRMSIFVYFYLIRRKGTSLSTWMRLASIVVSNQSAISPFSVLCPPFLFQSAMSPFSVYVPLFCLSPFSVSGCSRPVPPELSVPSQTAQHQNRPWAGCVAMDRETSRTSIKARSFCFPVLRTPRLT